ncbi:MAG: RagB/SusD family nutrient uptake outer membrane protein [Chitinophagaceae bacterium]|nr:RagB/SusD family nutrient uptake outer membrane protein [Chitinophagaceae bacterium]
MKTRTKHYLSSIFMASLILLVAACSKLEPEFGGPNSEAPVDKGGAPTPPSLSAVYEQLNQLVGQYGYQAMQEHSTDELMGPTRGTDWDDFGTWRRLHLHSWGPDHNQVNDVWNGLNGALFQTTLIAETASGSTKASGQFLRSFFRFLVVDLYGQMQARPATAPAAGIPNVIPRAQAVDTIIAELKAAIPNLPAYTKTNRMLATKEAAYFLLAKLYLNRAVYKQDPTKPAGPYTHSAADMKEVIDYCNLIAANTNLAVDDNYWDNFVWTNATASSENIFVRRNATDAQAGGGANLVWLTCMGGHYNQTPSGWNGFTTLSDFYDSFEAGDIRRGTSIPGYTDVVGIPSGFVVGPVQGPVDPANPKRRGRIGDPVGPLFTRSGAPLVFSRNVSIFFNSEANGIRTNKYPLDPSSINDGGWGSTNEWVFFRFSDVRLMKAEAILRGGVDANNETAVAIVNSIRSRRGATTLASVTLPVLLAERGRELYLEGWRRNDMIRFERFNAPVQERPTASDGYKVVYPIPTLALSSNPNLKQNFGY